MAAVAFRRRMRLRVSFRAAGRMLLAGLPLTVGLGLTVGLAPGVHARPAAVTRLAVPAALSPPVTPACISSPFGPRVLPNHPLAGSFHNGIDLPAPAGAAVHAIAAGTVIRAQRRGPGGLELLVQHHGFIGVYSHLGAVAPAIAQGRRSVRAGQKIGVVGHSGVMYGMHLFFAMERHGHFVDPARYLGLARCRIGIRRRSDMLAADGKIPPTRSYTQAAARYAQR